MPGQVEVQPFRHTSKPSKPSKLLQLRLDLKRDKHLYVLIAPYIVLFMIFTVLPVAMSLLISLTSFNMLEFPTWVGWANYERLLLEDDIFLIALKNTFVFAVITGPVSYIACFLFAWLINELRPKARALMTLVFYAPSISGNVYFIWQIMFSGDSYGIVNGFLLKVGIINEAVLWFQNPKYALTIIMIVQLWLSLGTSFLAFIAGLQSTDKSLFEAGAVDGVRNRWQELWYITLPSMRPQLMFGAVIQITSSLAVADVAMNLAGFPSVQYSAHTIVTHLIDYGTIRFEMGYASAIATVLFAIMLGSNLIIQKLLKRVGE
ncbi:carbohydrate ABC transporter permease [Paenibacillus sp. GCM10023250]|uniref:carbohydrate ABC transporter permease n=1 Tax=Paenibacillus sp. GCM10023250 TaxID=3252648 RepID=UPI00360AAC1F